ncbi:MAG TPA: hypothetical protein VGB99_16175 [Acidobacteriota bacterium]
MPAEPGWVALFCLQLGLGAHLLLTCVPLDSLGAGFLRFMCLVDGVATGLGWWLLPQRRAGALGLAALAALVLILLDAAGSGWRGYRAARRARVPLLAAGLATLVLGALRVAGAARLDGAASAALVSAHLAAALLLGCVVLDLILGHWYLVVPELSIEPFRRITRLLLGALLLRAALVAATIMLFGRGLGRGYDSLDFWVQSGIFWVMAAGCGLLVPLALSGFLLKTVELRSTQAATGIVYVVVFFVLMGELTFRHLAAATGLPL